MPREYQFEFELRHLIYFQAVATELHFRRAAERLAVAQPALSRQIAQLETRLGVSLFTRHRRKVELTEAGRQLLTRVTPLLQRAAAIAPEMAAFAAGQRGVLRIGFTGLAMATVLPGILRAFQKAHPAVHIELNESPTAAQLKALREGEIDVGFFHPDGPLVGLSTQLLLKEPNGILLPPDHPLATKEQISIRDLAGVPLVLFPRSLNPDFHDRIIGAFSRAGISPEIREEVWPRANGIGLVRAGLGVTFMSPSEAQDLPGDILFRPLTGPAPESRLVLGWNPDAERGSTHVATLRQILAP